MCPMVGSIALRRLIIAFIVLQMKLHIRFQRREASIDYVGSLLMAGAFLAVGSCISAATRNQVVAFILTVVVCFLLLLAGYPLVLNAISAIAPQGVVDAIASLSFLTHFESIGKGVIDLRDIIYFVLTILVWLYATAVVIDMKKAA